MPATSLLLVLCAGSLAAESKTRFSASLRSTVDTQSKVGGMSTSIMAAITGKIDYDGVFQKVRFNVKEIGMKMSAPGMDDMTGGSGGGNVGGGDAGGGDLGGGEFPDMEMPDTGRRLQDGWMMSTMEMTQLLRYDIKKNFTWYVGEGGQTKCECADLDTPFQPYQLPPDATLKGDEQITQKQTTGDKTVNVKKYDINFPLFEGALEFYVDASNDLRRVDSDFKMGEGEMEVTMSQQDDLWDFTYSHSDATFKPHSSCVCSKPVVPKIATAPPPEITSGAACSPTDGCKCFDEAQRSTAGIEFCKDIVKYPVSLNLFPKDTDNFAKDAHADSVFGKSTAECSTAYKEHLCLFFFQTCNNGELTYPPEFNSDTCTGSGEAGVAAGFYAETANLNAGKNAGGEVDFSAASTTNGHIQLAFVGVAALAHFY